MKPRRIRDMIITPEVDGGEENSERARADLLLIEILSQGSPKGDWNGSNDASVDDHPARPIYRDR